MLPPTLYTDDTAWDNALLACRVPSADDERRFSMLWETRRIAPGQMNSWSFEALGMDGGVRFSTRYPTTLERFVVRDGQQVWEQVQPGNVSAWPTISGKRRSNSAASMPVSLMPEGMLSSSFNA